MKIRTLHYYNSWPLRLLWVGACLLILVCACNKADQYYEKLDNQPEVVHNLKAAYAVGDTLILTGRLNPENGIEIYVGDVKSIYKVTSEGGIRDMDQLEIIINEEMGIGEKRSIKLTSAGINIDVGNIEIVGNANIAILEKQLQLVKVADIPNGSTIIYYRGDNGNSYLWNTNANKLSKIAANGGITDVFDVSKLHDENGSFSVEQFNAGAISPDERYFYFSAKVREMSQSRNIELYKLLRYDFQKGQLNTLNRTEYPLEKSQRTLENAQPFEGNVKSVKIFKITEIYPDSKGNVYFNLIQHFLTRLDTNNQYSYLFNFDLFADNFIPQILNPNNNTYYSYTDVHQLLPGIRIGNASDFDVDAKIMYRGLGGNYRVTQVSMETGFDIGDYTSNFIESNQLTIPYATVSLTNFNGNLSTWGALPENGKLIGLYFKDQISTGNSYYDNFYNRYELPAICEIDLKNNRARRYAPKRLLIKNFEVRENSSFQCLNKDKEGMLYVIVNEGRVLAKTTYVN